MSFCPQFLIIRPCKDNSSSYNFSPPTSTSFGFKEFVSNILEPIEVQCLYCHEFKEKAEKLCGVSGFQNTENTKKLCIEVKSDFHLCIKKENDFIYIHFQKRGKMSELNIKKILNELQKIHEINPDKKLKTTKSNIFLVLLECGQPAQNTENVAHTGNIIKELTLLLQEKTNNLFNKCSKITASVNDSRLTLSNNNKGIAGIKIVFS